MPGVSATRGSEWALGCEMNVEIFFHSADIEEDVPTYWHMPAGAGFRRE